MGKYKLWKLNNLKEGIDRFYQENGRYPTVSDLDNIDYLPSARWIQYKFGGIMQVRKDLGYQDSNLGAGKYRSQIALQINKNGLNFEHEIERFLIKKFGEPFVHIQKRVGLGRNRLDFYVYYKNGNFGVDVTVVSGHFRNVQTNLNIKIAKYKTLNLPIFFVVSGDYNQSQFDQWIIKRLSPFPNRCRIFTPANFMQYVSKLESLTIPLNSVMKFNASDRFAQETHRKYHPLAKQS